MIAPLLLQFVLVAVLCAIVLWALSQFPTLDATIVKFVRIAVLVVLSVMLLNVLLVAVFGRGISSILYGP